MDWQAVCQRSNGLLIRDFRTPNGGCVGVLGVGRNVRVVGRGEGYSTATIVCDAEVSDGSDLRGVVSCEWHEREQTIIAVALVAYPLTSPLRELVYTEPLRKSRPSLTVECDVPVVVSSRGE